MVRAALLRRSVVNKVRCAIYTRKSSDEGLDQAFNSLDAQREACEAYIKSQKHEGWKVLNDHYDDGGASGGNLERTALKRLMTEIDAGRVDMIVVYKIDRLTRSLADFAKLVERLDEAGASFVSVTQQFNTSTSMGRLTLNVLLSFAQFEREVTAERIRDKIAASKKKGMWMGGLVPLGFDKVEDELKVNAAEAVTVRALFNAYLEVGCVRKLKAFADDQGFRTKTRTLKNGVQIDGKPFSRGRLYHLLSNPIYIGKIRHKQELYEGLHDAIIEDALWDQVRWKVSDNAVTRKSRRNSANPSPLAGKVFDAEGRALTPNHANKSGRRYRYYVSATGIRLPATELEEAISGAVSADRDIALLQGRTGASDQPPDLVERVELHEGRLDIKCKLPGTGDPHLVSVPYSLRRRGVESRIVLNQSMPRKPDAVLIRRILKAMAWADQIRSGTSISDVAADEKVTPNYITNNLDLAYLSPTILKRILAGTQRADISAYQLSKRAIPVAWNEQDALFLD